MREALRRDVIELAGRIGERNDVCVDRLDAAASFIEESFRRSRLATSRQTFAVDSGSVANIEAEIRGATRSDEIVVIGAHYDSVYGSPGADDNASGTAALLAIARHFAGSSPARTLRLVAFVNEEPPNFQSETMGSVVYARRCASRRENIVAMICLESIGYYSDADGSQAYPSALSLIYPSRGNFIGFVGNLQSGGLVRKAIKVFRSNSTVAAEGAVLPEMVPGVAWSDQWSFWRAGYKAIMVTDTAPFRNPHYHTSHDTPETLDYDRLARVTEGLVAVVESLLDDDR